MTTIVVVRRQRVKRLMSVRPVMRATARGSILWIFNLGEVNIVTIQLTLQCSYYKMLGTAVVRIYFVSLLRQAVGPLCDPGLHRPDVKQTQLCEPRGIQSRDLNFYLTSPRPYLSMSLSVVLDR